MNKAKAIFATVIIAAVAGTSALLLHLNKDGFFGSQNGNDYENVYTTVVTTNGNSDTDEQDLHNKEDNTDDNVSDDVTISSTDVNEFLTVFSELYFSENKAYSDADADEYELIRFAYSYAMRNNRTLVSTEQIDDEIGYYNKISADYVNDILGRYFDKTVEHDSIYTEKTYAFFRYSDGYFYTPAADGINYVNVSIADNISQNGDVLTVDFSIYSSGVTTDMTSQQARRSSNDRYASGTAKFYVENGNYILKYYKVDK